MDFLRRLAPRSEGDPTRAVAALPSRFASERPLRETIGHARQAERPQDDEASRAFDALPASAASDVLAARRRSATGDQPSRSAPRPEIDIADSPVLQDRRGADSERTGPGATDLQGLAAALAVSDSLQGISAPSHSRVALPLSESIVAQRTRQSRDDSEVVHVTIGRIDVVAHPAPAPAVRRSPTPRQATVTLADYLRGGHGRRR